MVQAVEAVAHKVAERAQHEHSEPLVLARLQLCVEQAFVAQRKEAARARAELETRISAKLRQISAVRKSNPTIQELTALYDQVSALSHNL